MGKFEKKKTGSTAAGLSAVVVLAVILAAAAFLANQNGFGMTDMPESTAAPETQPIIPDTPTESADPDVKEAVEFPILLADGKLEISSLFQSTGINPDHSNQEGSDIATVVLTNTSDDMLTAATVTATLDDGTEIRFQAANLPAGKTAMVFSEDHISLPSDAVCVSIVGEADWDMSGQTMPEGVSASAEGMMITVTNHTAQDIPELIVYCRSPLGEEYYGGIAYEYKVTDLPANGSSTFVAADCILGLAEVVKIELPQE